MKIEFVFNRIRNFFDGNIEYVFLKLDCPYRTTFLVRNI